MQDGIEVAFDVWAFNSIQATMRAEVRAGLKQPGPAPAEEAVAWCGPQATQTALGGVGHVGQSRRSRSV